MEHTPKFRKSLADPKTGGLDMFRVIGAMHTANDEADGWHKSVTHTAGRLAVIMREGVEARLAADPDGSVWTPECLGDLMRMCNTRVTDCLGMERRWLELHELSRALPAYLGLKDERRWWLSELRGFCSDSLEERLATIDRECGTDRGDDYIVMCHTRLLDAAFRMLRDVVFGHDTTSAYADARSSTHTVNWRDDLTEALAKAVRPL